MNDFDLYLELNLRRMLDPVVTVDPPRRRRPKERRPILTVLPSSVEPAVEPVPVTVPVAPLV